MQKNILVSVIITSLIVAILASVATLSLTGNIIKVNQDARGKYRVYNVSETYSQEEVNSLVGSAKQDIINLLNTCKVIKDGQSMGVISCNDICLKTNQICVLGNYEGAINSCDYASGSINTPRFCKCC